MHLKIQALLLFGAMVAQPSLCAFDMPLKPCNGMRISSPSWMNGQQYGSAKGGGSYIPFTAIAYNLQPKASLFAPYSSISPQGGTLNSAGIRNWGVTTSYDGFMYLSGMKISRNRTSCFDGTFPNFMGSLNAMSVFDSITSGTFVGNRHIMITTDASFWSPTGQASGKARVLLVDYQVFGRWVSCKDETTPNPASILQIYPLMQRLPAPDGPWTEKQMDASTANAVQTTFHGCHADSYENETMANIRAPMQPFYIVCMSSDSATPPNWWLRSIKLFLLNSESDRISMADFGNFSATELGPAQRITEMHPVTVMPYPVHVVGRRLVLYRCFIGQVSVYGGDAHWCWRNFDSGVWGAENPALTTAVLDVGVLQGGMFLGWSGSEENALLNGAYPFFSRSSRTT